MLVWKTFYTRRTKQDALLIVRYERGHHRPKALHVNVAMSALVQVPFVQEHGVLTDRRSLEGQVHDLHEQYVFLTWGKRGNESLTLIFLAM